MSEQPAHPPSVPNDGQEPKPSTPAAKIALPKENTRSLSQHIFIWLLVVVVGVLFGMGGTVNFLKSPTRVINKIDESEILLRSNTARKLQEMINPMRRPFTMDGSDMFEKVDGQYGTGYEQWARAIQESRIADSEGLMPSGAALETIKKDFLSHPMADGSGKTFADAMREHHGGEKEVTNEELNRFLAERAAVELLFARNIVSPAVPLTLSDMYSNYRGDQVQIDEVMLDAKHLLAKVPDDDPEIQSTYDRLRSIRFGRPRVAVVTVAYADTKALADKAIIPDADIQKYYTEHKESYKKPPKPPEPAKPADPVKPGEAAKPAAPPAKTEPEYKTLAEVTEEIRAILKKKQAEQKAHDLVQAFNDAATDLENQKDNASFKLVAAKAGLVTKEGVAIDEPISGSELKVPNFGTLSESQLRIFSQDLNYIFSPIQSTGDNPTWMLLRLDQKREAGFRELKEPAVRAEVIAALAGQRSYKDLLKEAEVARAAAEKLGPGGLKKYVATDAGKVWQASVTSRAEPSTTELRAPPAEVGSMAAGEAKMVASLAIPAAPVMLTQADQSGSTGSEDVPKVRLIQVTGYIAAPAPSPEERERNLATLQYVIDGYRRSLYYTNELRTKMAK